jgi:hypothetical protein
MRKLLGGLFVSAIAVGCFFTFPRAQTNTSVVREIPVATTASDQNNGLAGGRSPASVETTHFQITEESLTELEKNREHLREFAKAEPAAGGWTIRILPGDKVFSKTGVRDGDQISLVELRTQAENAHQPLFADRFVDILRQIEN